MNIEAEMKNKFEYFMWNGAQTKEFPEHNSPNFNFLAFRIQPSLLNFKTVANPTSSELVKNWSQKFSRYANGKKRDEINNIISKSHDSALHYSLALLWEAPFLFWQNGSEMMKEKLQVQSVP